jgi:hypothetical protein
MSVAPISAFGSQRKPLARVPSASSIVPMQSGGGTRATKRPKASGASDQSSSSMVAPRSATRIMPGFAGEVPGRA